MIHHFYTSYEPTDPAAKERQRVARITWGTQLWQEIPVHDSDVPRLWEEEGKRYPYVKDVFDFACKGLPGEDIMVYTNADICVRSDCALVVVGAMQDTDAFYSFRRDFNVDFHEPIPDDAIARGSDYAGSDLYGFRVRWWTQHRDEFPDLVLALETWDAVIRHLIERTNQGKPVNLRDTNYHRRHSSFWEDSKNRYRLKGQLHNLTLSTQWLKSRGINPAIHGIPILK